jgi:hypothetical protein
MRKPNRFESFAVVLACGLIGIGHAGFGQDVVTVKSGQMTPAERLPAANLATMHMASPGAFAALNLKQQRMRPRHRPIPLGPLPPGVNPNAAGQPTVKETVLSTPLAPLSNPTVKLLFEHALTTTETNQGTSLVCEPSVAVRGQGGTDILYTANWFAAFSKNSGASFQYVNPGTTFPASSHGPFCCDQSVVYDPKNDVMFWILQYDNDATGNIQRLALAQGNDITNEAWHWYDFSPQSVGNWANELFDFPNLTVGSNYLYWSTNAFSTTGAQAFTRSVMMRLPLANLAKYEGFSYQHVEYTTVGGLRATQGATDPMYWAAQVNQTTLGVFTWPESSGQVTQNNVTVQTWSTNAMVAPGPDGRDWLGREDSRVNGAWQSGESIGFAWTASQDATYPFPQVRVAIMNNSTKALTAQPTIWSSQFAYAYPSLAPNSAGVPGISVAYGGKLLYPSHCYGIYTGSGWELVVSANGTSGPSSNVWGDYLTIHPNGNNPATWAATGFTLQGGSAQTNIQPLYLNFGTSP